MHRIVGMKTSLLTAAALALGVGAIVTSSIGPAEPTHRLPAPTLATASAGASETAYFAGGCFWGVEGVFEQVKGVTSAVSGYGNGRTGVGYDAVSSGTTGNAETVKIIFDPRQVSYARLLQIYFSVVTDPTTLNYQGPDHGPQYRSALFVTSPMQARQARAYIAQLSGAHAFGKPIVTTVEAYRSFTVAETEHQNFMARNPSYPYIVYNDAPKLAALRKLYPAIVKR